MALHECSTDPVTDMEQLYQTRLRRYVTAMRNGKPDQVPIRPFVAEFTGRYAGYDCQQLVHDYEMAFAAARKCAADFDWDAVVPNMVYVWTGLTQAMGLKYVGVPGIDVPPEERTPLVEQLLRVIFELQQENEKLRAEVLVVAVPSEDAARMLSGIAPGVAGRLVGILSALMAVQLERRKEFAVLRALGLTRAQVSLLIMLESGALYQAGRGEVPDGLAKRFPPPADLPASDMEVPEPGAVGRVERELAGHAELGLGDRARPVGTPVGKADVGVAPGGADLDGHGPAGVPGVIGVGPYAQRA